MRFNTNNILESVRTLKFIDRREDTGITNEIYQIGVNNNHNQTTVNNKGKFSLNYTRLYLPYFLVQFSKLLGVGIEKKQ